MLFNECYHFFFNRKFVRAATSPNYLLLVPLSHHRLPNDMYEEPYSV